MDILDSIMERYPTGAARIQRLLFYAENAAAPGGTQEGAAATEQDDMIKKAYQAISSTCKSEGNVVRYKSIFGNQKEGTGQSGGNGSMEEDISSPAASASQQAFKPPSPPRPTGVDYDAAWVDEQEGMARQSREVLEHRLQVAQSQLHKESIRTAYLALAQQAAASGDFVGAFHSFIRAKDYCTNRPQTTGVCLHIVSVSLAMGNLMAASDYIHKLEHTLRGGGGTAALAASLPAAEASGSINAPTAGSELDQILVQTAAALERMAAGKFSEALRSLIEVVQHEEVENAFANAGSGGKHNLLYWVAPKDVSLYAAFLCLCHGSSTEMMALADHVSALEWVPLLKQALTDFAHAKYQECWNCVAVTLLPVLKVDPYLGPHLDTLLMGIRRKILQNYWKAYSRAPLAVMAQDLGSSLVPSVEALRDEWITLILEEHEQKSSSGALANTRLDTATDTLHRDPPTSPAVVQAAKLQKLTQTVLDDSYSMVIRLACQESDLIVTSGNSSNNPDGPWRGRGKQGSGRRGGAMDRMMDEMDEDGDDEDVAVVGHFPAEDAAMMDAMNPEDLY